MFLHHYLKNLDISYSKPLKKKWVKVIKKNFFLYKKLKATSVVNTNPSFKNTQKLTQLLTIYTTFGTHKTNHLNYQFF